MPPALTIAGGQVTCTVPDVCNTPSPTGTVPIPYPNLGEPAMAEPTTETVFIAGALACTKSSQIELSDGDQAGSSGGVASGEIMGKVAFVLASFKVKLDGNPAVYQGNLTTHNANNTIGMVAACGQMIVSING